MIYNRPVKAGDVLTATATEISRSSKLSHYRVDVVRGDGKLVAGLTGTAFISGQPIEV
jgi:acyl-CoA thioesterase